MAFGLLFAACNKLDTVSIAPSQRASLLHGKTIEQECTSLNTLFKTLMPASSNCAANPTVLEIIKQVATTESNKGDTSDYYASFAAVDSVLNLNNMSLAAILKMNGTKADSMLINELADNDYKLTGTHLDYKLRFFVPSLNVAEYPGVDLGEARPAVGVLFYELDSTYFQGREYSISDKTYVNQTFKKSDLDGQLFILVSAFASDKNGEDYSTKGTESAGRCAPSRTTGRCVMPGRGCPCEGSRPIVPPAPKG